MGLLYKREETDDKITISFRFYSLKLIILIILLGLLLLLTLFHDICSTTVMTITAVLLLAFYYYEYQIPLREIAKARKEGRVTKSGSRLPWKTLTFEIKKTISTPPASAQDT
jgi:uncharacterized membrane protein